MLVDNGNALGADSAARVFDGAAARAFNPSWVARISARLRSRSLDQALVDGADPAGSSQLAARAARLTTRSTRVQAAEALERLARPELEARSLWRVFPSRSATRANVAELNDLAARLRGPGPVYARGVAMLRLLVSDGTGPAYSDRQGGALAAHLRQARAAIGG